MLIVPFGVETCTNFCVSRQTIFEIMRRFNWQFRRVNQSARDEAFGDRARKLFRAWWQMDEHEQSNGTTKKSCSPKHCVCVRWNRICRRTQTHTDERIVHKWRQNGSFAHAECVIVHHFYQSKDKNGLEWMSNCKSITLSTRMVWSYELPHMVEWSSYTMN